VTRYTPPPWGVTVGVEVPCSIEDIHGSTSSVRPSTGVPSLALVTVSWTSLVPRDGGWGDVRTSRTRAFESLMVVAYGSDGKVAWGDGAALEHAVEAPSTAATRQARKSWFIVIVAQGTLT
jgi:hypothetical protein